jgi:MFS family permease
VRVEFDIMSTSTNENLRTAPSRANFHKLWAGQGVSQFGSQVSLLAIPTLAILVYRATPFQASVIGALQVAPFAIFSLPAGPLADRLPRRAIIIVCDLVRAAAVAILTLTYMAGVHQMWVIYVVATVVGTFTVLFDITYMSFVPQVVAEGDLLAANTRLSATNSAATTAGPALGGLLISALVADTVSYLVSAIAVARMRVEAPRLHKPKLRLRVLYTEIREGLAYVIRSPILARIAVVNAVFDFGAAIVQGVYLVFLYNSLHLTPSEVGFTMAVTGASFLIGALLVPRVVRTFGIERTLVYSILAGGAIELLTPLTLLGSAIPILTAINIVAGSTNALYDINQLTIRQSLTPDELQGRLHATMRMTFAGPRPFGYLLGGLLGTSIGTATTIFLGALVSTLGASVLLTGPVRRLRLLDENEH